MFGIKMTKRKRRKIKHFFVLCIFVIGIAYIAYSMGQNDVKISDVKKQIGIGTPPTSNPPVQKQEESKPEPVAQETKNENDTQGVPDFSRESSLIDLSLLPVGVDFGNPVSLGATKFSYSDLKGLEVNIGSFQSDTLNCGNVTEFLDNIQNNWFYWNTCRSIVSDDDGISFYVIRLAEDKKSYVYEKHYIVYELGLYGVYELLLGISADEENIALDIQAQNSALKDRNEDFGVVAIVDGLFQKIIQQ